MKDFRLAARQLLRYPSFSAVVIATSKGAAGRLLELLGGKPVAAPRVTFPFSDEAAFLELAQTLEDTGVSAYNGAGRSLKSSELLATAGSIVQVEARHAARVRLARNAPPAPSAFDPALDEPAVTKAVQPFLMP